MVDRDIFKFGQKLNRQTEDVHLCISVKKYYNSKLPTLYAQLPDT